ncbi:Cyclin-dependent kinase inhibitor 3 (CDKN3) [Aliiroseovarius halocynthiae]|uniref:Protein phosphatase n=1 Tax=Aliiroseovarius halocynthiae TaxID=985055 RepID=A0A545SZQ4_9RHOB|nr:protein-tyrosine phosphatase family protein [Aliiroseovarius halocynthiae]TQV70430.1 protein phosphatase [Aliiroseovarius halocynthiae]SMR81853.1 Cyclin-dependent kinase inhibitor 3 (CDKN3) [Aliiroseovarius halocynthiae]
MEPLFPIASLQAGNGTLGICPLPGRSGDYREDVQTLIQWAPDMVLSMTTAREMGSFGASDLGEDLERENIIWHHLPIQDFGAPTAKIITNWQAISPKAHDILAGGGKVLAHCKGGCGRSGMMLLRMLAEIGEDPTTALARLRNARPCAVETDAQFQWASGP